jgi:hypothetical protein
MKLKTGARYFSQACTTEVIVVKAPDGDVQLSCAGHPMVDGEARRSATSTLEPLPEWLGGSALGKRYGDTAGSIQLLVVKPGAGTLAVDGVALEARAAKALPSSD